MSRDVRHLIILPCGLEMGDAPWSSGCARPRPATARTPSSGPGPRHASMFAPVFPRRDRIRVCPQAAAFLSRLALSVGEFARLVVPHVSPGEAVADHFRFGLHLVADGQQRQEACSPADRPFRARRIWPACEPFGGDPSDAPAGAGQLPTDGSCRVRICPEGRFESLRERKFRCSTDSIGVPWVLTTSTSVESESVRELPA
jgi:hypothetical protein